MFAVEVNSGTQIDQANSSALCASFMNVPRSCSSGHARSPAPPGAVLRGRALVAEQERAVDLLDVDRPSWTSRRLLTGEVSLGLRFSASFAKLRAQPFDRPGSQIWDASERCVCGFSQIADSFQSGEFYSISDSSGQAHHVD
jgi:hypothetical protein